MLYSISDGSSVEGTDGFYFLPPMVTNPAYGGTFDAALQPVVEICETTACDALHARYSTTEGSGSEVVRLEEEDQHYIVNWHARATGAVSGRTYRVRVVVSDVVLGHADVAVVGTGREAVEVRSDGLIAIVASQTLPIKFRIETGIVGAVVVSPAEAAVEVGDTQQFAAAVYDLHGVPLEGHSITWSSDQEDVAMVDSNGLAEGVVQGTALISASAGTATGSAVLDVLAGQVYPSITLAVVFGPGANRGYDFLNERYAGISGGDFYAAGSGFWANNSGQEGLVDMGSTSGPLEDVAVPASGYLRINVPIVLGHTYVSRAKSGEPDYYIIFRVTAYEVGQSVTLEWVRVFRP